jgi:hypothetical protein
VDSIIASYSHSETQRFQKLEALMREARHRGHMTRADLLAVVDWKSSRARPLSLLNHAASIRVATSRAFAATSDEMRIRHLLSLHGVAVPMASTILAAMDPRKYAVIDIRVWQALYRYRAVSCNKSGRALRVSHWLEYTRQIRELARRNGVSARVVEQALFHHHKNQLQRGALYGDV